MDRNKTLNIDNDEQLLLAETKQILDYESEHLHMATLLKLERSRTQALQQPASTAIVNNGNTLNLNTLVFRKYWPGSVVALSMLLLLTFFALQRETFQIENSVEIYSDLELLSSQQALDFYENLDFYQWLEIDEKN